MRCISLWQLWASLIAIDAKRIETRSWPTSWRGPVAIHAAKSREGLSYFNTSPFKECLRAGGIARLEDVPFGAVLCVADLIDCVPTESLDGKISSQERAFGNYAPERWAWVLDNIRAFQTPIPALGKQGFFHWVMPANAELRDLQLSPKGN